MAQSYATVNPIIVDTSHEYIGLNTSRIAYATLDNALAGAAMLWVTDDNNAGVKRTRIGLGPFIQHEADTLLGWYAVMAGEFETNMYIHFGRDGFYYVDVNA